MHEGQLHRANRAAAGGPVSYGGGERGGRGEGKGRAGGGGAMQRRDVGLDALCAGRKPDRKVAPLAKGFAEELDKSMFWDEPIV